MLKENQMQSYIQTMSYQSMYQLCHTVDGVIWCSGKVAPQTPKQGANSTWRIPEQDSLEDPNRKAWFFILSQLMFNTIFRKDVSK